MLYERVIPRKTSGRALVWNILLISLYVLGVLTGILCLVLLFSPPLFVLVLLLTLIFFLVTKKYLKVEYEYSFEGESFSIAKIYNKQARRSIVEIDLRKTLITAPADKDNLGRATRLHPDRILELTSYPNAPHTYFTIFEDESENRILVYFEGDEKSLGIIKRINPIVTTVHTFS